jgi:hypothetical protein
MNIDKEKTLHYIAAKYILGENIDVSINANDAQIDCLYELLNVSKCLKETLDKQEDFDKIKVLVKQKKKLSSKFKSLTGIKWRL